MQLSFYINNCFIRFLSRVFSRTPNLFKKKYIYIVFGVLKRTQKRLDLDSFVNTLI
uniref:Uncharacterized protein n=1 Tax=Anguilla anguilla TaxID=7936 RepID=A0A0E9WSS1_ANGAN